MSPDPADDRIATGQDSRRQVLIVDDEPTVRLLLARIVRREVPCEVTEAVNGAEALDLLGRRRFDFVALDVVMPVMDGIETLAAIRASPSLARLPVMVLSAVRDERQVRRLVALGISAYLTKPLRPLDACERIRRFIASIAAPEEGTRARPWQGDDRTTADARTLAELRGEMLAATEQFFGMMLGVEIATASSTGDVVTLVGGSDLARVRISRPAQAADVEFAVIAEHVVSERMTAMLLPNADVVTSQDVAATFEELANIVGGRLQSALRARGEEVSTSLPTIEAVPAGGFMPSGWSRIEFATVAGDIRLTGLVRMVPRGPARWHTPPGGPVPLAVARPARAC